MNSSNREEEIFESTNDNDEINVPINNHTLINARKESDRNNKDIITTKINADEAFQVFNGKLYQNLPISSISNQIYDSNYYSIADSIEKRTESPIQRYQRLKMELNELQIDLNQMMIESNSNSSNNNNDSNSNNNNDISSNTLVNPSIWSLLQEEVHQLIRSSDELNNHKLLQSISNNNISSHTNELLNELIQKIDPTVVPTSSTTISLEDKTQSQQELLSIQTSTSISMSKKDKSNQQEQQLKMIQLEQRVFYLETILGNISNIKDTTGSYTNPLLKPLNPFPLIDTVVELQDKLSLLNMDQLDHYRTMIDSFKSDLDNTLMKSKQTITNETKVIEASRSLKDIIMFYDRVNSVIHELPQILIRLKTLEQIHLAASTFNSRLNQMESDVKAITNDLVSNKDVLMALKTNMIDNLTVIQQNIDTVNQKINLSINK